MVNEEEVEDDDGFFRWKCAKAPSGCSHFERFADGILLEAVTFFVSKEGIFNLLCSGPALLCSIYIYLGGSL